MEPVAWKIERIAKRARNDSLQKTISEAHFLTRSKV